MFKKVTAFLFSLILFVGTLYGLSVLYGIIIQEKGIHQKEKNRSSRVDETITFKGQDKIFDISPLNQGLKIPQPNLFNIIADSKASVTKFFQDQILYKRTYIINSYGMRQLVHFNHTRESHHLILSGCSYVFGEGLVDEDTLPYILERENSEFNAYNLGVIGGSLNTALHFLNIVNLDEFVKEKEGVFIYTYFQDHMNRFLARPDFLQWGLSIHPFYKVRQNKAIYKGLLADQDFYKEFKRIEKLGMLETYLRGSQIVQPKNKYSDEEFNQFSIAIRELKLKYLKKFPRGQFIFLRHPFDNSKRESWDELNKRLTQNGIQVVDPVDDFYEYLRINKKTSSDFIIKNDGHPNKELNRFLADVIKNKILNLKRSIKR